MNIDDIDRKIVRYLSTGVQSYNDLSKLCNIGRSTVYRRLEKLEKAGILERATFAVPNFERLQLSAVVIGINVKAQEVDRVAEYLKLQPQVKFMWKTFGAHDLVFVMVCKRGEEGDCVHSMRAALESLGIGMSKFDSSTSFSWTKIDLNPYFENSDT